MCFRSRTKERSITNVSSTGSGCLGAPPPQTLTKIGNGKTVFRVSVMCLLVTVLRGDQYRLKTAKLSGVSFRITISVAVITFNSNMRYVCQEVEKKGVDVLFNYPYVYT